MQKLLYVAACVLAPIAWGAAVAALSGALRRRGGEAAPRPDRRRLPPIDYYI